MSNHPNRNTERVTIENLRGQAERVTLPQPMFEGRREIQTGVTLEALYYGPRTGRMFARSYSIWDRGDGTCRGTVYRELDRDEFLRLCDRVGAEVPAAITPTAID